MRKGRVLFLVDRFSPHVTGGLDLRVRAIHQSLRNLADVRIVTRASIEEPPSLHSPSSSSNSPQSFEPFVSAIRNPTDLYGFSRTPESTEKLLNVLWEYRPSLVLLSRLKSTAYLQTIRKNCKAKIIVDLDEVMTFLGPQLTNLQEKVGPKAIWALYSNAESTYEKEVISKADHLLVSSEIELSRLQSLTNRPASVVKNGVYLPNRDSILSSDRDLDQIIFPSNMLYPPNIAAAKELIEEILPVLPWARLLIAGSYLPNWLKDSQSNRIKCIERPTSMLSLWLRAGMLVAPLRAGGGTRLKILEAMASGVPVITTPKGAEGLGITPDVHYLVGTTSQEIALQATRVRQNELLREHLVRESRLFVEKHHSVQAITKQLRTSLSEISLGGE
jgi:glycosyltransferase involved in cell wall biosynthesis